MLILVYIFCGIYAFQFILIAVIGRNYAQKTFYTEEPIQSVSVLIPFRNEADRIQNLIHCINKLHIRQELDVEFLFIDDHSTDQSTSVINNNLKIDYRIISSAKSGKKEAIRRGCQEAKNTFILTWDADVSVPKDYFDELTNLPEADMWILPVMMNAKSIFGKLAAVDFSWLQLITYVMAVRKKPILCNGANLLFKKESFFDAEELRKDYALVSGDDHFLLHTFKDLKKRICTSKRMELTVTTEAPNNMRDLLIQRKRWLSKMKHGWDINFVFLSIILVFVLLTELACIAYFFVTLNPVFLIPLGMKFLNEYVLLRLYKKQIDVLTDVPVVMIHQVFFPFYLLIIQLMPKPLDDRWDHSSENN